MEFYAWMAHPLKCYYTQQCKIEDMGASQIKFFFIFNFTYLQSNLHQKSHPHMCRYILDSGFHKPRVHKGLGRNIQSLKYKQEELIIWLFN